MNTNTKVKPPNRITNKPVISFCDTKALSLINTLAKPIESKTKRGYVLQGRGCNCNNRTEI